MAYHASGKPTLRTGSVVMVPPKPRASVAYGNRVSNTPYARESANGWSPRLLADVESRYSRKAANRYKGKVTTSKSNTRSEIFAAERKLAGTVKMGDMD